jgi:hypothetical protein
VTVAAGDDDPGCGWRSAEGERRALSDDSVVLVIEKDNVGRACDKVRRKCPSTIRYQVRNA